MLQVHYAGEGQYLEVNQRAGPRLCLPGPKQLHMDPTKHASIHVRDAILVNANEALVIYGNSEKGGSQGEKLKPIVEGGFERRVLYGPTRYVPKPDEWIHEFSWHGTDPHNKTAKVKDMLKFNLLPIIADQFYNVRVVRTKDDMTITADDLLGACRSCEYAGLDPQSHRRLHQCCVLRHYPVLLWPQL